VNETQTLAEFAANFSTEAVPADVLQLSARCLADHLGISLGAWEEPAVQIARAVAEEAGGNPQAALLGGGRTSYVQAATINGIASHVLDFDDTHEPTILHGTGAVMSAAMAAAEERDVSGLELLAAHAIGFEVAARIALAVNPEHYDQGFHVTGTANTFGAAAAAGRLLGMNAEQMQHALSASAAQAAGLREMFGSMSKSLHAGKAAGNGMYSALLARRGWVSTAQGLEGRRGYWATLSSRVDPSVATNRLGETWELHHNGQKPYACGVVSHPTIDAMRKLRQIAGLAPDDVQEVVAQVNPYVLELMGKTDLRMGLEGKFSIYHCAAAGYIDGAARVRQFTDDAVYRPELVAMRQKFRAEIDPSLPTSAAKVRLTARDGRQWEETVSAATGTPGNPMTEADLQEKFLDLVADILPGDRGQQLFAAAIGATNLPKVSQLVALLP
jgi:2-methylcitrate dehydratase PrpD